MSSCTAFSNALLHQNPQCPTGLRTWNGSDPGVRFDVYRNNVIVSLVDAIADTYPVVQAMVGEPFFRAMAADYARQNPPDSPVLAWYGKTFPDFLAQFPPVAELAYLPDLARLEWLRVESWHAADAKPMSSDDLSSLTSNPDRLYHTRFTLHPALRILRSDHPIVSLWAAHQEYDSEPALDTLSLSEAETALLVRPALDVEIIPIDAGAAEFVTQLHAGATLADALEASAPFDLPALLALLIRSEALIGFSIKEESS